MSIEITLQFSNYEEAMAAMRVLWERTSAGAPTAVTTIKPDGSKQQVVNGGAAAQPQAPVPQQPAASAPAPANGGAVTVEQVNAAFKAYLQKGQGRTAKTAMDVILTPMGLQSTKSASAEQLPQLLAAFEEATKDAVA